MKHRWLELHVVEGAVVLEDLIDHLQNSMSVSEKSMWQQLKPPDVEGEGDNGEMVAEREGDEVGLHLAMRTDVYSVNMLGYRISEGRDMHFIIVYRWKSVSTVVCSISTARSKTASCYAYRRLLHQYVSVPYI